jgi:2-polyprenyl-3-methyl-5-hydroxy-6-metoxy-1,4-benzoquinol methylase
MNMIRPAIRRLFRGELFQSINGVDMDSMAVENVVPWKIPPRPGETESDLLNRRSRAMFAYQRAGTDEYWRRIDPVPDLTAARVLDLGCGHGVLTVDLAQRGATEVLGLDLDTDAISFAHDYVPDAYPSLRDKVRFVAHDIADLTGSEQFDYVFSKDAFEHILDLEGVVGHIHRLLKPGGKLILGTSPLYFSPFGDHDLIGHRIPWLTALPESPLFRFAAWKNGMHWRNAADAGLNRMTPAKFRSLFQPSEWRIEMINYNVGMSPKMAPLLNALRKLPSLEKYATVSIYAHITKQPDTSA